MMVHEGLKDAPVEDFENTLDLNFNEATKFKGRFFGDWIMGYSHVLVR
jgi:hypothetical protein